MPIDMKLVIAGTFAKLSKTKPVDKITVKDLVEECGISRQSFYYHFQDILDVMEWSIRQILNNAQQKSVQAPEAQKAIEIFIDSIVEYGDILVKLIQSQKRSWAEEYFMDAMSSCIRQVIICKKPDLNLNHNDLQITLRFYSAGMTAVIFDSCKNKSADNKNLARQIYQILNGSILI